MGRSITIANENPYPVTVYYRHNKSEGGGVVKVDLTAKGGKQDRLVTAYCDRQFEVVAKNSSDAYYPYKHAITKTLSHGQFRVVGKGVQNATHTETFGLFLKSVSGFASPAFS